MSEYRLRPATADDRDFITDMLVEAINWKPGREFSRAQALAEPEIVHYVTDWMRPSDLGVIAVDAADRPIGACWLRYFSADDPSYGYIADDVPELNISVIADWRGSGVGRALLHAALDIAREQGIARVGLSVEHGNRAAKLYYEQGFTFHEEAGDADTLIATL